MKHVFTLTLLLLCGLGFAQNQLSGQVLIQENNETYPLTGASIYWLNTSEGTVSNEKGGFTLPMSDKTNRLIIQYLGFKTDTLTVDSSQKIIHFMKEENGESLAEVELVQRRKSIQKSYLEAQNMMQVSSEELLKAACCNLSESFETNPSIDVNFSDALTGTKQIKMLGLSSPYLMITEENIPTVRGAAQVYGLTFTPGTWVESIQITKGAGSVTNGFESIVGQINTELQKPFKDAPFFLNLFSSANGRQEANIHLNKVLNGRWSTGAYIHLNQRSLETDQNKDGFLDFPLSKQINLLNRWQYIDAEKGWVGFASLRYLNDQKKAGEKSTVERSNPWESEINTQRWDATLKTGYVFPIMTYQSFGLQMAYSQHLQEASFGFRVYDIQHDSYFGTFLFNSILGNTLHRFSSGINFNWDRYNEQVDVQNYQRTDQSIGAFFEYTYEGSEQWNVVAGLRLDHHNQLGTFLTPRLHVRYTPWESAALRFSAGQGRKAANFFAENQSLFMTNRTFDIRSNGGSIYGLEPEVAWNFGGSFRQGFTLFNQRGDATLDFYRTQFINQVVVDIETPRYARFYNLEGESFANSLQFEIDYTPFKNASLRLAYKNYQVKTTFLDGLKQRPLQPQDRFFANMDYVLLNEQGKGWRADMTFHYTGKQRLPENARDGIGFSSDAFQLWNAQLTRVFSPQFEIYLGGENLLNYRQTDPIIGVDQPYGRNFDASLVYAPVFGRMLYLGLRYQPKKKEK